MYTTCAYVLTANNYCCPDLYKYEKEIFNVWWNQLNWNREVMNYLNIVNFRKFSVKSGKKTSGK